MGDKTPLIKLTSHYILNIAEDSVFLTDPDLQSLLNLVELLFQVTRRTSVKTTERKGGSFKNSLKPLQHFQGFMKTRNNQKIRKYNKKHTSWRTEKSAQRRQKVFYWFLGNQNAWRLVEARIIVWLT